MGYEARERFDADDEDLKVDESELDDEPPTDAEELAELRAKYNLLEIEYGKVNRALTEALSVDAVAMPGRPRCEASLIITPTTGAGQYMSDSSLKLNVTGSMVAVGEIVRAAGRIFAEDMYMHDADVPDSANRGD